MKDSERHLHIQELNAEIIACHRCPRLSRYRKAIGDEKRRAYKNEEYWAKPLPGFGDVDARIVIIGLAPGAHGANRTGRMFTGDRSGQWLFRALHKSGFANQSTYERAQDGLILKGAYITNIVRCAPPKNQPSAKERDSCLGYFYRELALLSQARVLIALGGFAWEACWKSFRHLGLTTRSTPKFEHGLQCDDQLPWAVIASYHPSQQNTFTGRLTEPMFDAIFDAAREIAHSA